MTDDEVLSDRSRPAGPSLWLHSPAPDPALDARRPRTAQLPARSRLPVFPASGGYRRRHGDPHLHRGRLRGRRMVQRRRREGSLQRPSCSRSPVARSNPSRPIRKPVPPKVPGERRVGGLRQEPSAASRTRSWWRSVLQQRRARDVAGLVTAHTRRRPFDRAVLSAHMAHG
jgi:hypothetical protein